MEIPDCTSVAPTTESENLSFEKITHAPKGLGSIRDSIGFRTLSPKKPNLFLRAGISACLLTIQIMTLGLQWFHWTWDSIFGTVGSQKMLYYKLYKTALKNNVEKVEKFLTKHRAHNFLAGYLFSEFLHLPELYSHMSELLKGANICLEGDKGFFFNRWNRHPSCYKRISSHKFQKDTCYAMDHFLFWVDPEGHTRFQFENSPWNGILSSIHHIIDYLRYQRDNEQQGVVGTSPHTEQHCLRVKIDTTRFKEQGIST